MQLDRNNDCSYHVEYAQSSLLCILLKKVIKNTVLYPVCFIHINNIKSSFHNNYSFHKIISNDSQCMNISMFISDILALRIDRILTR